MRARPSDRLFVTAGLLATVLIFAHAAHRALPELFEPLAAQVTDRLFTLRSNVAFLTPAYDDTVVHIPIDDRSLRERLDFYLDREEYARVVRNLGPAVAAQFHDAVFAAPQTESADTALSEATAEAGNVYYGMAAGLAASATEFDRSMLDPAARDVIDRNGWTIRVEGDRSSMLTVTRPFVTFPELSSSARGIGFLDIIPDPDGVYRRAPLLARDGDRFIPGLPLRVVCDYLGVGPERIVLRPGREIVLEGARWPREDAARDLHIPIDGRGQMIVNYIGPWGRMKAYPLMVVYDASDDRFELEDLQNELRGKVVIVSEVATGQGDVGPVPTDPLFPRSGIHANAIHGMLTGEFIRDLSTLEMLLWVELPLLLVLLLASMRLPTVLFVGFSAGVVLTFHVGAAAAFLFGNLILNVPRPVIIMVLATLVVAAYHYHLESKAKAVLRTAFDAYFPPSVVDKIMAQSAQLAAAAQKKELTILFSDIVGFTQHTSTMEAGHVRHLLNEYFERMIEIVFSHEGTLDKFIGDGLMVFFGDPERQDDHAERGVRTAIEMQRAARELARIWAERGDMPLIIRVGVNTGEVIVGNMGSTRRLSYTALGEPVNLAQRLESSAPAGGVLISARTHELLDGKIATERREPVQVKGFDRPVEVFEVFLD
jgi:adenylate cyclase